MGNKCAFGTPGIANVDGLHLLQGKGLLGFVSNAVGHNNSRIQVEFKHPETNETVPTVRLKAQGQHAAEEMPLYVITDNTKICGQV